MTVEQVKRDLAKIKEKLAVEKVSGPSGEVKQLLQLYAQGLSDWQQDEYRKPWKLNYSEALRRFAPEFSRPEGPSKQTLYWLGFMASFRGYPDETEQKKSELMFWLLARRVAPQTVEQLLSGSEEKKLFLKKLNEVSAETV
jgi:hypothetical protein